MSNKLELLDDDFVKIVKDIEKDILDTRYNIMVTKLCFSR